MSGLFHHPASVTQQIYAGIQISTSLYGSAIPLIYGMNRGSMNLLWYGNFASHKQNTGGGKGGNNGAGTTYTYSASWAAALCEGPITGIGQIFHDRSIVTLVYENLTLFLGSGGQAAWTTPPLSQRVPYDHIAYVATPAYNLGSSAAMPNLSFEIKGLLYNTGPPGPTFGGTFTGTLTSGSNVIKNVSPPGALVVGSILSDSAGAIPGGTTVSSINSGAGGSTGWSITMNNTASSNAPGDTISFTVTGSSTGDADPSSIFVDYLTDVNHGANFPGTIATLTGNNNYQGYVWSLGIGLSPTETTQRNANQFLQDLMQMTNSDIVDSAGTLKVIPYADSTVSGNGYSYAPNITPLWSLTDDDFIHDQSSDPVILTRKPLSETYNYVTVEYLDRTNYYNTAIVEAFDLNDINANGVRHAPTYSFHAITNSVTAKTVAQLLLQASLFRRNTYKFKIRSDYQLLEPFDCIGITDSGLGLVDQEVWITQITESANGELEIEAMEITGVSGTAPVYNWSAAQGYAQNYNSDPGSVLAPLIFMMPPLLAANGTVSQLQVGIAVNCAASQTNWGGCYVYMSFDNSTYEYIGYVSNGARYGTIGGLAVGTDPDTTNSVVVTFNNTNEVLAAGTSTDADNMRTLMVIDPNGTAEIIAYSAATPGSPGVYTLGTYIRRGLYQTPIGSHGSGVPFARLDGNIFVVDLDPGMKGQTAYFKFISYNTAGAAVESVASVPYYTQTLSNSMLGNLSVVSTGSVMNWIAYGSAIVGQDNIVSKITGTNAWDSCAVTTQGYGQAFIQAKIETVPASFTGPMVGLTTTPGSNLGGTFTYGNIDYAWYNAAGTWYIYESGSSIGSYGSSAFADTVGITYDASTIAYYLNGVVKRTVSNPAQTVYGKVALNTVGSYACGLHYGNSPTLPQWDTAQIGGNAATNVFIYANPNTSVFTPPAAGHNAFGSNALAITNMPSYDCVVIVTITVQCAITAANGSTGIGIEAYYVEPVSASPGANQYSTVQIPLTATSTLYTLQYQFSHVHGNSGSGSAGNSAAGISIYVTSFSSAPSISANYLTVQAEFIKR